MVPILAADCQHGGKKTNCGPLTLKDLSFAARMINLTSFHGFYATFPGAGGQRWGMHGEMKADIDKNGSCTGAHSCVMQLYEAPFSFSANAFFTIPFLRGMGTGAGLKAREQTEDISEPSRTLPSLLTML